MSEVWSLKHWCDKLLTDCLNVLFICDIQRKAIQIKKKKKK